MGGVEQGPELLVVDGKIDIVSDPDEWTALTKIEFRKQQMNIQE